MPIVKTTSLRESVSADASQPKAMAIIRGPVRLPGRRREAIRPAIANAQTTGSPNATYMSPFACTRVVASTWVTPTRGGSEREHDEHGGAAAVHRQKRREPRARELRLGDEPARAAGGHQRPEVVAVAARREHDLDGAGARRHPLRDGEPVHIGQLHVEQDHVGSELGRAAHARGPVPGLADDLEPLGLEQGAGARPESGMVIDDEHAVGHVDHRPIRSRTARYG